MNCVTFLKIGVRDRRLDKTIFVCILGYPLIINFVIMLLLIGFMAIRSFLFGKNNIPILQEARRNENAGLYEAAIRDYESALAELSMIRFHHVLRGRISDKIKLLHTILDYQKNIHFIR